MSEPGSERDELAGLIEKDVVLDARGEFVYVGRLTKIGDWYYTLTDADVHDAAASRTSKEVYLIEAAKYGIKKNRHEVMVRKSEVVSISLLEQVILY